MKKINLKFLVLVTLVVFFCACSHSKKEGTTSDPNNAVKSGEEAVVGLVSLAVSPVEMSVLKGDTLQFKAVGTYSDSTTADITNAVVWSSSDATIASINADALATGLVVGLSNIKATIGSVSNETSLKVKMQVLYLPNTDSGDVSMYEINFNTGLLSPLAPAVVSVGQAGDNPMVVELHPNGKYAYVGYMNSAGSFLNIFDIDQNTGVLTNVASPVQINNVVSTILDIKVHPSGAFLYATTLDNNSAYMTKFNILANGLLTQSGVPTPLVGAPFYMTFHPSGSVLYLVDLFPNNNKVLEYKVNLTTGDLTPLGSGFIHVQNIRDLAVHPTENNIYIARMLTGGFSIIVNYKLNADYSIGDVYHTQNTVFGVMRILMNHLKNSLYALAQPNGGGKLGRHSLTGIELSNVLQPQIVTNSSMNMINDPMGKFLYVTNGSNNTISMYKVDEDGQLSALNPATVPTGNNNTPSIAQKMATAIIPAGL